MTTRSIIMRGDEVRGILEGRKSQFRRALDPQPVFQDGCWFLDDGTGWETQERDKWPCPFGQPGGRLWVRETFAPRQDVDPKTDPEKARHYCMYRASGGDPRDPNNFHDFGGRWIPSNRMPRELFRLTLEVTDVRVDRLQEISEADAEAEGCDRPAGFPIGPNFMRDVYRGVWEYRNGAGSWDANPWVWAVTFRTTSTARGQL